MTLEVKDIFLFLLGGGGILGLTKWLYESYTDKPKIKGKIIGVVSGGMLHKGQMLTVFLVYLYLSNMRKGKIHIIDYELEMDRGNGYEKMERVYGFHKMENLVFENGSLEKIGEKILWSGKQPLEYGVPMHGFVVFASKKPHKEFRNLIDKFKITCVDVFGNKHKIISKTPLPSIHLLEDLVGTNLNF